ncbi:MAG TPA: hypothetical protein VGB42_10910 [Candidatus Thermoplasmatota archaeon]
MFATLMMALVLEGAEPAAPRPPGIYFGDVALCSLEKPAPTTTFRSVARLPKAPSFVLVLSKAAMDFGINDESLLLIERRLGGVIMISVRITATVVPGREGVYEILPAADLWPDDYSFAISKNSAIVFFGCSFTTLP